MGFASKLTTNFFAKGDAALEPAPAGESPSASHPDAGGSATAAARRLGGFRSRSASEALAAESADDLRAVPIGGQFQPGRLNLLLGAFVGGVLLTMLAAWQNSAVDARLAGHPAGAPLQPEFTRAFAYSDGWVDDARLVVLNALDAHERGARVLTHAACADVVRRGAHWEARIDQDGAPLTVRARGLVNAAGPWAAGFAGRANREAPHRALRLVKGSHIVVPRLFDHGCAYLFQHIDGRVVFAIPYEEAFTLVGTTDVDFAGDPGAVAIGEGETRYLCALVNRYFKRQLAPGDVVWSYSGVRPLLDDDAGKAAATTRDYFLERDASGPPLLSVFGGKITTYRKLAEEAVDWIAPRLGRQAPAWTGNAVLPGGDLFGPRPDARGVLEFDGWVAALRRRHPWLPAPLALRYARAYGTRVERLLDGYAGVEDLGLAVVPGLYEAELRYLMREEWATCAADVLWRRSKLGLHMTAQEQARFADWWDGAVR